MFESVINVVSAHKQFVIAIAAFAVVAGSFSYIPSAAAQGIPGVDVDLSDGVMVDVTNDRYIHIDVNDGRVIVEVDGTRIDTGSFNGFAP
jgi:hypothetical protein